jgi:hypothetical protein
MNKVHVVDAGPLREGGKGPQANVMFTAFEVRLAGSVIADRLEARGGVNTHASF